MTCNHLQAGPHPRTPNQINPPPHDHSHRTIPTLGMSPSPLRQTTMWPAAPKEHIHPVMTPTLLPRDHHQDINHNISPIHPPLTLQLILNTHLHRARLRMILTNPTLIPNQTTIGSPSLIQRSSHRRPQLPTKKVPAPMLLVILPSRRATGLLRIRCYPRAGSVTSNVAPCLRSTHPSL